MTTTVSAGYEFEYVFGVEESTQSIFLDFYDCSQFDTLRSIKTKFTFTFVLF